MKAVLIVLAVLLTASLSYAGNGDLIVNGKLGVGTTSPTVPLQVVSPQNSGDLTAIKFGLGGHLISEAGAQAAISGGAYWNGSQMIAEDTGAGLFQTCYGDFIITTDTGLTVGYPFVPTPRLYITNTGNVGIGTTQPSSILNVDPHGAGWILVGNPNTGSGGFTSLSIGISAQSGGYSSLQSAKSSGAAWGDIVLNGFGGNVGIGTSNFGSGGNAALLMAGGSRPSSFDGIALYASGSALRVSDQYGNEGWVGPNFSPSSLEAPEVLYDAEESLPAIETEVQYYAGFVRYTNKTRQAKLAGMTDAEKQQLSPARRTCVIKETFAEHEARPGERLTQLIWEEEQAKIKQMKDAERQALIEEKARLTAAAEAKDKEIAAAKDKNKASIQKESAKLREKLKSIKISEEYVMQPIPPRLQAALGK